MKNINIALLSPNKNAYSETFIQQHRYGLEGNVIFYFNGSIPVENDKGGKLLTVLKTLKYNCKRKLKLTHFTVQELALIESFRKQKIKVVVAEFGPTAVSVLNVCKHLQLPLIPVFHGYDASVIAVLEKYFNSYIEIFQYAYKIIAVSNAISQTLINMGCAKGKIVVTPCAPNDRFFDIMPKFKNPTFIGVGRFVDKKAPYYTILAFSKVLLAYPESKLILIGDGPLYNTCKNLVSFLKIEKNVELPGVITPEKLPKYFEEALAFVQHSVTSGNGDAEGTPVAVLEASAAALPIISTIHAGIPDVVIQNQTGFLVKEHDVEEMALKMIYLLQNYPLANEMGNAGRVNVKKHFSMKKHLGVINSIVKESLS